MKRPSTLRVVIAALAVSVTIAGCTDLSSVRDWSGSSLQGVQFASVVETYADTPERLAYYDADAQDFHQQQAEIRAKQGEALELQLALVSDYMAALNALAANGVTEYSKDVRTLTEALEDTGVVSGPTVGAAGKLATTLLEAATNAWRRYQVTRLIEQANDPLQTLLAGELASIVGEDFRRDLAIERQFLDRYFEDLLRDPESDAAGRAALNEWFILRKEENARRQAAIDAYLVILDKVAEGHQRLYEERNDLAAKALAKDLFKLAKDIRRQLKKVLRA